MSYLQPTKTVVCFHVSVLMSSEKDLLTALCALSVLLSSLDFFRFVFPSSLLFHSQQHNTTNTERMQRPQAQPNGSDQTETRKTRSFTLSEALQETHRRVQTNPLVIVFTDAAYSAVRANEQALHCLLLCLEQKHQCTLENCFAKQQCIDLNATSQLSCTSSEERFCSINIFQDSGLAKKDKNNSSFQM